MAQLNAAREKARQRAEEVFEAATEVVLEQALRYVPVKTGALRDSLQLSDVSFDGKSFRRRLFSDLEYAEYVDQGTNRHRIDGNPLLAFFWENGPDGPGDYFFHYVEHPGYRGAFFMGGDGGSYDVSATYRDGLLGAIQ